MKRTLSLLSILTTLGLAATSCDEGPGDSSPLAGANGDCDSCSSGGAAATGGSGAGHAGDGGSPYVGLDVPEGSLTLWYDEPAQVWNEALPLGNGRLGAMVFGGPGVERLQLNESSFWSGGPSRNDNPLALAALATARQQIFAGQYTAAEATINQNMRATQLHGSMYQTIGDLSLRFSGHEAYTDYHRELDLARAVHRTSYEVAGIVYEREIFASRPDEVIVVHLAADRPGSLSFSIGVDGPRKTAMNVLDDHTLELKGLSSSHEGVTGQVRFDARVSISNTGGSTRTTNDGIEVDAADDVVLLVAIATNFVDYRTLSADEVARSAAALSAAAERPYASLLGDHVSSFQDAFGRVAIDLGESGSSLPTNERVAEFANAEDAELLEMYFQFGRYLLLSSSRPGGQPANLQGIWNGSTNPAWDSKYTININTEMNYWPAEKCNLAETHEPLFRMIEELSESGQQTASTMYGASGWVAHHNTDIWRISGVVDGALWGMWPMGGAWLSQHLWEHYVYGGDEEFLASVYPILKSACEFYRDFLIEEPDHQWLVVSPSISPENSPAGHGTSVVAGATMDNQILFDLFSKTLRAAEILEIDDAATDDFLEILGRLPPMQIGRHGQLQEWMEDWDSPNDQHRHVSHLYGLFPSGQISAYDSPELFDAARTTLIQRGDVSTGWSMGWKVNFWARLLDGNHALKLIRDQLHLVDPIADDAGGTYPNLFDAHPPFQIDGNFGCTSGMTEMLLQSFDGFLHVLPALPDAWKASGGVRGLRAYGGFEVDVLWKDGKITRLAVRSTLGGNARLRVPNELTREDGSALSPATGENPNHFYEKSTVQEPLISPAATLNEVSVAPTFVYDLATEAGRGYLLIAPED